MTAQEIAANIAKLEAALANSALTVQFADRTVTYKSSAQILDQIAYFRSLRSEQSGRGRQSFGVSSKGF